ncbi:hypothetical protein KFE25_011467 [Diacronema lutheri]|uniref:Uncharacterized protein n=1 Tax=Diacronema lutheri TaxID=2081491 RepID=A0A8J5XBV2_DIALT|nr:hypothetical protein KFE25_011467 [Diacronema lutheri]
MQRNTRIRDLQHVADGQALLCRLAHIHTQLTGRPPRYNVAPLRTHNVPRNVRLTANAIWDTLPDDERKELRARLKALDLRDHDGEPLKRIKRGVDVAMQTAHSLGKPNILAKSCTLRSLLRRSPLVLIARLARFREELPLHKGSVVGENGRLCCPLPGSIATGTSSSGTSPGLM